MNKMLMAAAVGVAITLASCQKDAVKNLSPGESRIYITNHDSTVTFSQYKTFSIADSVGVIEDNQFLGKDNSDYDLAVVGAIRAAMEARGFQEVPHTSSPDLGITISRVYSNSTGLISYPGYWDMYGSYYDPYYWGYGGYNYYDPYYYGPNYYATYQITQGALTIDMLDLKNASSNNSIKPVWSALARGSGVFATSAAEGEINAFFEQSPYLGTNQ